MAELSSSRIEPKREEVIDYKGLPEFYGETKIVLLPRDPHWMFTYWEVTDEIKNSIINQIGKDNFDRSQSILRVHDVTGIEFNGSNSIKFLDISCSLDARNWYIYVEDLDRWWCVELGLRTPENQFILIARSNFIRLPPGRVSEMTDERWAMMKEEFEKLIELSGTEHIGKGSLELAKMLAQRWEFMQAAFSWPGSAGISSVGIQRRIPGVEVEEQFWLKVGCELIVYGATLPDATVTIDGKPIQLEPEGTFSLRFILPDGVLNIPINATSKSGSQYRQTSISVEKKTLG